MGEYVYRVTAELVKLADGRKAHVVKYAYKPYHSFNSGKLNQQMRVKSGCLASERLVLKSDLIATVSDDRTEANVFENKCGFRVFSDYAFGTDRMPHVCECKII